MVTCSVGICVFNEEKNIANLLDSLLNQKLKNVIIDEIIIISSGSTDKTDHIVKNYIRKNTKIHLVKQKKREGKASAVNQFVENAKNDVLVLLGGDIILDKMLIERLVKEFETQEIGMTGAHPIPFNGGDENFSKFAAYLLWELHHRISLDAPKMGEVITFRKIFKRIPVLSSVDEANIEPLIRGQGYRIKYIPEAKVYNKAPITIDDFIAQRRRIFSGHLAVKHEQSYEVSTFSVFNIIIVLFNFLIESRNLKYFLFTPFVVFLEAYSRFLGWWDYVVAKKRHTVWQVIKTTKELGDI